LGPFPSI